MPGKKKDSKTGQPSASWEKADETLQAVILTDSFNFRFLPVTLEKPRVSHKLTYVNEFSICYNCTLVTYLKIHHACLILNFFTTYPKNVSF